MELGDERAGGLEAADAERAEVEAAAEAGLDASAVAPAGSTSTVDAGGRAASSGMPADPPERGGDVRPSPICPFLRLERDGGWSEPLGAADTDHRCTALAMPVPLSETQQSLVCLVASHVDCPRYLRGSHVVPVLEPAPMRRSVPAPTLAAAAVLVLSLTLALGYTAANGGLAIQIAPPTPTASAATVPTPTASPSAAPPTAAASAAPSGPPPSPDATPSPSSPGPTPSAVASSSIAGGATADRLALLTPCADRPDCYVYTVRAGDNLTSIGLFFGVPFDTILRLNPWIRDPSTIRKGDRITLPTPTR